MTRSVRAHPSADLAKKYSKCLLLPYDNAMRIPDGNATRTSLIKARRKIQVPFPTHNDDPVYKFSMVAQPKLGKVDDPSHYQIGFVDYSKGPNPDLSSHTSWRHVVDDVDVALDTNAKWLTSSNCGGSLYRIWPDDPVIVQPRPLEDFEWLLAGPNDDVPVKDPAFVAREASYNSGGIQGSKITLPTGGYGIGLRFSGTATANPTPFRLYKAGTSGAPQVLSARFTVGVISATLAWQQYAQYYVLMSPGDYLILEDITPMNAVTLAVTPSNSPNLTYNINTGVIEKIRPVAMSVLTTCNASSLANGGTVSTTIASADSGDKIFDANAQWNSTAGITNFPHYYTGPVKHGCYTWWRPATDEDSFFRDVDNHSEYQFPTVLVHADMQPVNGEAVTHGAITVTIETVFEIIHNSQLFESELSSYSRDALPLARTACAMMPVAFKNDTHIANILSGIGGVLGGLLGGPAGGALGATAGKLLGDVF